MIRAVLGALAVAAMLAACVSPRIDPGLAPAVGAILNHN